MKIRHRQNGFTLIEVLIAALVLAIGLLSLAGLQTVSLKMKQGSILRAQATALAIEITDAMRANKGNASGYAGIITETCNLELPYTWGSDIAASDVVIWGNRLACLLPSGKGEIMVTSPGTPPRITATVTVEWDETRLGDSIQTFSTTTEL